MRSTKELQDIPDISSSESNLSHLPTDARELFSRLEMLKQSKDAQACIALIKHLLKLVSPKDDPLLWAKLQMNLGSVYEANLIGKVDQRTQLRQAITCYDAALTVYIPETTPANWANAQLKKGNALRELPD